MNFPRFVHLTRLLLAACLGWSAVGLVAADTPALGLDPVYPHLNPDRTHVLTAEETAAALARLPGWEVADGILFKVFATGSFRSAIALIVRISYPMDQLDHHPEIRNVYGKVYVGFTTYDQGKQVTGLDVETALAVEAALADEAAPH